MEQPAIFEDSFGMELLTRRRSLLPIFLKIYIWIGIIIFSLLLILILFTLGDSVCWFGCNSNNSMGHLNMANTIYHHYT